MENSAIKASRKFSKKWRISNFLGKEIREKTILGKMLCTKALVVRITYVFVMLYWVRVGRGY